MLIVFVQSLSINGMQEGLGTGSVNTQKEKVLDNLNKQINSNGIC